MKPEKLSSRFSDANKLLATGMNSADIPALQRHLTELLQDYRDLAPSFCPTLQQTPSGLEALRLVSKNHPALINGWTPLKSSASTLDWAKSETVIKQLKGALEAEPEITVAITDDGFADSVRPNAADGKTYFVKPHEAKMSAASFFDKLADKSSKEIVYLQSQNGNICREVYPRDETTIEDAQPEPELRAFAEILEEEVTWMSEALDVKPEAVNLWIGDERSVTSPHHDPYENIYHVLTGSKTFTLLPPIEGLWVAQTLQTPATLDENLQIVPDEGSVYQVPWVSLPPPALSHLWPSPLQPIKVTVTEGQTLYLPSGWWHAVEQESGPGGYCIAVNYWYTSDLHPERYALERLARRVAKTAGRPGILVDDDLASLAGESRPEDGLWEGESDCSGEEWNPADWGR